MLGFKQCQQVLILVTLTSPINVNQHCDFAFVTRHLFAHQELIYFNVYKCFSLSIFPFINISCNYAGSLLPIYLFVHVLYQ